MCSDTNFFSENIFETKKSFIRVSIQATKRLKRQIFEKRETDFSGWVSEGEN